MAKPILRVNSEESTSVVMKRSTVLPGKAHWYYITVNMLVYLDNTNKRILRTPTCSEKTRAQRICFERSKNNSNLWQVVWRAKPHPLNNFCAGNRS